MTINTIYLPINCCGKQMDDVFIGDERVMAFCSVCNKTWRSKTSELKITKLNVTVKAHPSSEEEFKEAEERVVEIADILSREIQNELKKSLEEEYQKMLFGSGAMDKAPIGIIEAMRLEEKNGDK